MVGKINEPADLKVLGVWEDDNGTELRVDWTGGFYYLTIEEAGDQKFFCLAYAKEIRSIIKKLEGLLEEVPGE